MKKKAQGNKVQISVTVDPALISWVDDRIQSKIFSSRSHAIERALLVMKEREESRKADRA